MHPLEVKSKQHYQDLLDRNPSATVGVQLAAKMVASCYTHAGGSLHIPTLIRTLKGQYGENMTNAQVRREMALTSND